MYILGINAYHGDAAAAIFRDGELIAATEEERIRRIKHWAGFPSEAIRFCLKEAGISIEQVEHIAISRDPSAKKLEKILFALTHPMMALRSLDRIKNQKKVASVKDELEVIFGAAIKAQIHNLEHHRCHLASAFFASSCEESAILSIDGMGDFTSTMLGVGKGNKIEVLDTLSYPHSLGFFYTAMTQFLGFPNYGDEYKVMGLAPYGEPEFVEKLKEIEILEENGLFRLNLKYFTHTKTGVKMSWDNGEPKIEPLFSDELSKLFGTPRKKDDELTQYHKNLAASVQKMCEETIFHCLNSLHKKTGLKNICIAGGVAQNSVANGKVLANTPFESLYIPPAGHDAGTAIGAGLYLYNQILDKGRTSAQMHSCFGARFSNDYIKGFLDSSSIKYSELNDDELFDKITDSLIGGEVVGWFQGRAEFGPRALGHRSIIADPRRIDAKDILNLKIKRRESFRPFAPSILKECVGDYFESVDDVPFMEKVFVIKDEKRGVIPAVTHVDGTGRLQSVDKSVEPKYHGLIEAFYKKTGVPILLNTSFNENEPIVNTPKEALVCFLRTKMDMLVMENIVVER